MAGVSSSLSSSPNPFQFRPRPQSPSITATQPKDHNPRVNFSIPFETIAQNNLPFPSPLPLLPLAPPQLTSLKGSLTRRRSSYPPVNTPGSSAGFTYTLGGTPNGKNADLEINLDTQGFGTEISGGIGMGDSWDRLLSFDPSPRQIPLKLNARIVERSSTASPKASSALVMTRAKSEPGEQKSSAQALFSPGKIAQFGSDLAWRTILGSVVEVEGVGEVGVCKVLQEVWKLGGGETVTSQCLWPSIIVALCLSSDSTERTATPSAQSALALQELYNLTLKLWEPSIFTGLLGAYAATSTPTAMAPAIDFPPVSVPKYGAATPTKEFDQSFSQWTNLTPGLGGDFSTLFGTGLTPRGSISHPSNLGQFEFHPENDNISVNGSIGGIDEILASMEREQENGEREIVRAAASVQATPVASTSSLPASQTSRSIQSRSSSAFQLPTPETDIEHPEETPRRQSTQLGSQLSPESMASPFVTASSGSSSHVSKELNTVIIAGNNRAAHPTSLIMPTEAFVPPPPMCMFFNPSFRDLQQGKVGVWKGDLNLKGKGGGVFSVLIVGEEVSGHLWQSHLWTPTLTYPLDQSADNETSSFTSKMIPVAYLAREGFTPVTMGMVLCNDANIEAYVAMVQHLHAEGVAFHLPNSANLPIVFLPAKFDPKDPLQRLGIAYMTKPGAPIPTAAKAKVPRMNESEGTNSGPQKKKRRQSAPAKPATGSTKRRDTFATMRANLRGGKVEEDVIAEEKGS